MRISSSVLLTGCFLFLNHTPVLSDGIAIAPQLGTQGIGIAFVHRLTPKLNARLSFNTVSIDRELERDDIEYEAEYVNSGFGAQLDWHPFSGSFRLSAGIVRHEPKIDLEAVGQGDYEVGDKTYVGNLTVNGELNFRKVSPYFTFGWGNPVSENRRFSFNFEAGVVIQGEPVVKLNATGLASELGSTNVLDVSTDPEFLAQIELERSNLEDEASDLEAFPMVSIGISFQL